MNLTQEQKTIGRRNFLKATAAITPIVSSINQAEAISKRLKVGVIGTGVEGRILISVMNRRLIELKALCDIRPDSKRKGIEQAELHHGPVEFYTDYHQMLEEADIEAIVIATPLRLHGPMALECLKAGKHVFVEKSMAYTPQECEDIKRLAEQKNLHVQVGYQRFYNPLYWQAADMVHSGTLGDVYHIRCVWHRNSNWDYRVHYDSDAPELEGFDPTKWGYEDMLHLVNWRWFKHYSHGLWTELASHQLSVASWFLGDKENDASPVEVSAMGGIYHYHDEREIPDHIYAMLEYPRGKTVMYSSILTNGFENYYELVMGTRGTILLTRENESYLFWEAGWDPEKEEQKTTQVIVDTESKDNSAFAAQDTVAAKKGQPLGQMPKTDPYRFELEGFVRTIQQGEPCYSHAGRGLLTARICQAAIESLRGRKRVNLG